MIYIQGFLGKVFGSHFFIHRFLPFSVGITCFFLISGRLLSNLHSLFFWRGAWLDTKGLLHDVRYQCFGLHSCSSIYIYI